MPKEKVVPFPNAIKADAGKPPLSLISRCATEAEGRVLGFGAKKYAPDNWRKGFAWRRLIDATLRHVFALADGEDRDPETGELHTAHARCMLGFLHEHMERGLGQDDRYKSPLPLHLHHNENDFPVTTVGWCEPDVEASRAVPPPARKPEVKKPFTFWYLATPYSKYPDGHEAAFRMAARVTARLVMRRVPVFCPIAHSHPVSEFVMGVDKTDHDFWMNVDRPMMDAASGLLIYCDTGWETSRSVQEEIRAFKEAGKPVVCWNTAHEIPLDVLHEYSGNRPAI